MEEHLKILLERTAALHEAVHQHVQRLDTTTCSIELCRADDIIDADAD